MLRRVEDQRRIKDGEAERREDLNEKQCGRSLRSLGETAFEKLAIKRSSCRSTRHGIMSSATRAVPARLQKVRLRCLDL